MNDIRANRLIKEVLDSTNKLVNIDIKDVRDLFQEGGELHAFDVSVPTDKENRMQQLMEQVKNVMNHIIAFWCFSSSPKNDHC